MKLQTRLADLLFRINRKAYYSLRYFYYRRRLPNYCNPRNISEFLLSEMLKPSFKQYAPYADKVKVRDYVKAKGLGDILPKCYGVWKDSSEIDFEKLPKEVAIKTNHGCGHHVICRDVRSLDKKKTVASLNKMLSERFSIREPHYQYIEPLVYAEELIDDGTGLFPVDYKFMCTKGVPRCILVCSNRDMKRNRHDVAIYSTDWKRLPWATSDENKTEMAPPAHLERMIEMAKKLSEDFDFVRVDLYDTPQGVIFSELTFSPHSGFLAHFTLEALEEIGKGVCQ